MHAWLGAERSRRRILLLGVAGFLSLSALLAVGILLFGRFGETEGRILGTTALLAGYGLLALPAAILLDQRRLRGLAAASVALAVAAASLALVSVWSGGGSETVGKIVGTATVALAATAQTAALAARRRDADPGSARLLFPVSVALAAAAAGVLTAAMWTGGGAGYGRIGGALVVLDALAVALQPLLARAQQTPAEVHLRLGVESGEEVELTLAAPDLATAAARAIRQLEREGRRVRTLETLR